jgi:hypothetical protein
LPLLLIVFVLLLVGVVILLTPLTLVQRYRVGTRRRPARGWLATFNAAMFGLSAVLLLASAALTNLWLPHAFVSALGGVGLGCALGVLGLALSRWDVTPSTLHYTPNRWLVLVITAVVSGRLAYSVWRGWLSWRAGLDAAAWLVQSGAAGSLAAGAVVLGYYLAYWIGVRRRVARYRRLVRPGGGAGR